MNNNNINYKSKSKSIKIKRNSSDLNSSDLNSSDLNSSSTTTESENSSEFDVTCSSSLDSCFTIKNIKVSEMESLSKTLPSENSTMCFNKQKKLTSKTNSKLSSESIFKLNTNKLDNKESCKIKVDVDTIFPFSDN
jgi:hypothetical protein